METEKMAKRSTAVVEVLQAIEVNGNTYQVPATLEELACAINRETEAIAAAEGSALEHSVIEGQFLIEARRRVKTEKKKGDAGWMKWLEANYKGGTTSAHRSISIAEYFPHVENAGSRMEALRIIDGLKKAALESGASNTPQRGRPRKQIAAPATEEVVVPATNGNGNGHGDGREEYRAALAGEVNAIQTVSTSAPVHVVTVSPATFDENEDGPGDEELSSDPEIAEILAEFEAGAPDETQAEVESVVVITDVPEGPSTTRFQFTGSPQQVELQRFQATLDRFEVELGPVTLNRAFDADLTGLTVLITDVQIRLDSLLERVNKVVEDRKIRTDLKAARQEGLLV